MDIVEFDKGSGWKHCIRIYCIYLFFPVRFFFVINMIKKGE